MTLDILSVQGSIEYEWGKRESRAIWRGRDSRQERLKLVEIARSNPDLFNVSLTNFFFFRDKEAEYGPKQPHISFYKFFDVSSLIFYPSHGSKRNIFYVRDPQLINFFFVKK